MKTVQRWSTDDIEPGKRLHFWREAVHQSLVEMDVKPAELSPAFMSSIVACQLASLAPHQAKGSAQTVRRGRAEISRGEKNAYYLLSQPTLPWRIKHAGIDAYVAPGESVLIDSREPYEFIFAQGLDDLSIEMPLEWVNRWLPEPGAVIGRPLTCTTGWGAALRSFKEALVPENLTSLAMSEVLLEDQVGVLLSLASGKSSPHTNTSSDLLRRCISIMRERLSDSELVATTVANSAGISVRGLHRTFAAAGKTFAHVLIELRIEEASRMLTSRRFDSITISEIARRCGFSDASHFTRRFQTLRATAPSDFRKANRR
jgi:AraC family transcriptional regulator, positive regulator of tynA and feaB